MGWFASPLGLLALLAVPAVVALHLFRRRFTPRRVSALFLWSPDDRSAVAGRRVEKLHQSPSFWLELLAAAALALAFASPRLPWIEPARHLVVVLDGSLSLAAGEGDAAGSARDRAVAAVRERLAALPRRSRATLIESGPTPRLLAGPAALPAEAGDALDRFEPTLGHHDLGPALTFAEEIAGGGALWLVTDDFTPDALPPAVELLSVGAARDNVGFTHAARTRERGEEQLFLTIASFSTREEKRTLQLAAGGAALPSRAITLPPGERTHLSFALPAGTPTLVARLERDALRGDDEVWLAPVLPRTVALATTFDREQALQLRLASGVEGRPLVDRWVELVPDAAAAATPEAADLVVGAAPFASPRAWNLVVAASAGDASERRDLVGPFLIEKRHPLLRGVTLDGVVWSRDPAQPWTGAPLVCAGDVPLLTEETRDGARTFTLHLDPRRSSLQRSPDWPIALANLAELRRGELPGPLRTNLRAGEALRVRGAGEGTWVLRKVEGAAEPPREVAARGTLVVDGLVRAGLWRVEPAGGARFDVAVQTLDAAESDLRARKGGERPSPLALAEIDSSFNALDAALIAVALLLLLVDWGWLAGRR